MLTEFINSHYVRPIVEGTGYNIVNTLTYGVILLLGVFLVLKIMEKMNITLDRTLFVNLIPFVVLGGVVRALQDTGFFSSLGIYQYLFVTPVVYVIVFLLAFISLLTVNTFNINQRYLGYSGLVILGLFLVPVALNSIRTSAFVLILVVTGLSCASAWALLVKFKEKVFSKVTCWSPILAHALDSSATVVAITVVGGYAEQHVLPALIFRFLPVAVFIPLKIALVSAAIYFIDREIEGRWSWMLKFTVLVLGLGPGTRNALTILMGT